MSILLKVHVWLCVYNLWGMVTCTTVGMLVNGQRALLGVEVGKAVK